MVTLTSDRSPVSPQGSRIGCTLPEALDAVRVGDRVFFDDGKIGVVVVRCRSGEVDVQVTMAGVGGTKLRGEKGINLPDTELDLLALTDDDGLGIVLRIETVHGFERLPGLLLAAMASERVGVMVARGDLAVESGFERLAEVQEEIL